MCRFHLSKLVYSLSPSLQKWKENANIPLNCAICPDSVQCTFHGSKSVFHASHGVPVAFIVQVVVAFVFEVVDNAAPGLVAAEVVGAPEISLVAGVLIAVFGIGAGGGGIEARFAAINGVVGFPHLRGSSHCFAGDMVAAQRLEQLRPLFVARKVPARGADAAERMHNGFIAGLVRGQVHGSGPIVQESMARIGRGGVVGGEFRLRCGEGWVVIPSCA